MVPHVQYLDTLLMEFNFSNRTVIVTGGTRGIGLAIVKLFEKYNANVIATGTDESQIIEFNKNRNGRHTTYKHLDFTSESSVNTFISGLKEHSKIDVLINNAGVNKINSIQDIEMKDWDWISNVNLRGPFQITREVSKKMQVQSYGRIVNISSIFGVVSKSMRASYSTTKWGLIGFTKAISLDLAKENILANAVSPGFVNTELTRKILGEKEIEELVETIPQKRLASPNEIAKTVIFLSSDHNTYITGQNIIVDGGFTIA